MNWNSYDFCSYLFNAKTKTYVNIYDKLKLTGKIGVRELIERGADINAKANSKRRRDKEGQH